MNPNRNMRFQIHLVRGSEGEESDMRYSYNQADYSYLSCSAQAQLKLAVPGKATKTKLSPSSVPVIIHHLPFSIYTSNSIKCAQNSDPFDDLGIKSKKYLFNAP